SCGCSSRRRHTRSRRDWSSDVCSADLKKTKEAMENRSNGSPTMQQYIRQMQGEIKKALPSVMTPERFSRIVLSALSANPKLSERSEERRVGKECPLHVGH